MSKKQRAELNNEQLTKKLRAHRKKIKELEARVQNLEKTNTNLMFNLRIVMRQLKLKPKFPNKDG